MTAAPEERARLVRWATPAVVLLIAVFVLPGPFTELCSHSTGLTVGGLPAVVTRGFDAWVASGAAEPDVELASAVHFWRIFHGVKALLAITLLAVVVAGWPHLSRTARAAAALAGALALVIAVANIQGFVAPLTSTLTLLPVGHPTSAMTTMHSELSAGIATPMTAAILTDFRVYHAVVVVCMAVLGGAVVVVAVRSRRRRATLSRRMYVGLQLAAAALLIIVGVVLVANLSTVLDTGPALLAVYGTGR